MAWLSRLSAMAVFATLAAHAAPVEACSYSRPPNEAATRNHVQQAIATSDALVEGVVERDGLGDGISVLRATRLWRGPRQSYFRISVPTSCHMGFSAEDVGRRVRVALWFLPATQTYAMSIVRQPRRFDQLLRRELRRMPSYVP